MDLDHFDPILQSYIDLLNLHSYFYETVLGSSYIPLDIVPSLYT